MSTLQTLRRPLGQIAFCVGCCCGRPDRGYPPVPVDRLKAAWKAEKLNKAIQLTISGCLGPCDLPNVALVLTPERAVWLGNLKTDADYDAVLDWARECQSTGTLKPIPPTIADRVFDRFPAGS